MSKLGSFVKWGVAHKVLKTQPHTRHYFSFLIINLEVFFFSLKLYHLKLPYFTKKQNKTKHSTAKPS
jgi:hypothetical protein